MRRARFLSPSAERDFSLYHCVSRVVDRQFVLGQREKDVFVRMMREYEAFCGVRVLSYCVMSNHFHLLVEVPPKREGEVVAVDDEEFLRRIKPLYSKVYYRGIEQMLERFRADGADAAVEELKVKFTYRMHDLSEFMKGLKQRFTQWYNGTHGRSGTLWEGRFKSVLVEDGYAARVMAAYIDLNPVRAGMVAKPEDYRWCSYAEAMGGAMGGAMGARATLAKLATPGRKRAREGYGILLEKRWRAERQKMQGEGLWDEGIAQRYRMMLFADGEEVFSEEISSGMALGERKLRLVRKGFKRKEVEDVLARGGKLSFGEALRCRVRYLSDGMTFGSRDFVDEVFRKSRERFGEKRKSGPRPIRGVGWQQKQTRLYSMRQLVKDALG